MASEQSDLLYDGAPALSEDYWDWRHRLERGRVPSLWDAFQAGARAGVARERGVAESDAEVLERFGLLDVPLSGRESQVLAAMGRAPGGVLMRDAIVHAVWGPAEYHENMVRVVVDRVRRKLDSARAGVCVSTIFQKGYRMHRVDDGVPCAPAWRSSQRYGFVPLCRRGPSS